MKEGAMIKGISVLLVLSISTSTGNWISDGNAIPKGLSTFLKYWPIHKRYRKYAQPKVSNRKLEAVSAHHLHNPTRHIANGDHRMFERLPKDPAADGANFGKRRNIMRILASKPIIGVDNSGELNSNDENFNYISPISPKKSDYRSAIKPKRFNEDDLLYDSEQLKEFLKPHLSDSLEKSYESDYEGTEPQNSHEDKYSFMPDMYTNDMALDKRWKSKLKPVKGPRFAKASNKNSHGSGEQLKALKGLNWNIRAKFPKVNAISQRYTTKDEFNESSEDQDFISESLRESEEESEGNDDGVSDDDNFDSSGKSGNEAVSFDSSAYNEPHSVSQARDSGKTFHLQQNSVFDSEGAVTAKGQLYDRYPKSVPNDYENEFPLLEQLYNYLKKSEVNYGDQDLENRDLSNLKMKSLTSYNRRGNRNTDISKQDDVNGNIEKIYMPRDKTAVATMVRKKSFLPNEPSRLLRLTDDEQSSKQEDSNFPQKTECDDSECQSELTHSINSRSEFNNEKHGGPDIADPGVICLLVFDAMLVFTLVVLVTMMSVRSNNASIKEAKSKKDVVLGQSHKYSWLIFIISVMISFRTKLRRLFKRVKRKKPRNSEKKHVNITNLPPLLPKHLASKQAIDKKELFSID